MLSGVRADEESFDTLLLDLLSALPVDDSQIT